MSRLTKGMYGLGGRKPTSNLFGLTSGQIRPNEFCHNAGWYNHRGEKLGWGDLTREDIGNIFANLNADEAFFILPEACSMGDDDLSVEQTVKNAELMLTKGVIYGHPAYPDILIERFKDFPK